MMTKRLPKKLRGDAARTVKLARVAADASKAALDGEARRRTLMRTIGALVSRLGGEVVVPFREISGAPDVEMKVEGQGAEQTMRFRALAARPGVMLGDAVVVHSWGADPGAEPTRTGLEWPGKVVAIERGEVLVVELSDPIERGREMERVVVPRGWTTPAEPVALAP